MMVVSLRASKAGLAIVDQVRKQKGWAKKGRAWLEAAEISESTLKRFWQGHAIQEKNFTAICAAVGVDWQEIVSVHAEEQIELPKRPQQIVVDWRSVCSRMLPNCLTPLAGGSEDVTLKLENLSLELQQGAESGRRLGQSEFFQEVLQTRHINMAPWKMAIVGPSGVGKTTLLRTIADWVFQCTDRQVAIWVSLADLGKKNLEDYLLKTWLKEAIQTDITPEIATALANKIQTGHVWLLLDGVSEMDSRQENPLQVLASQMRDWMKMARILLTCKLDVWEAGKNALAEFEVYRYWEFNSQQVERYINSWFINKPQQAKQLREKLQQPGQERIRDIVKRPLELSLLCCIWQLQQGDWPVSYMDLFQQFTMALYESKQERPTGDRKRRTLNKALAKLALRGLEQPECQLRLRERIVLEELKTPKMLELVQQIGWLHQVGVAAREPVYAFAHPRFQIYFAATEIPNWHLLFEQMLPPGVDRIFEDQWQQVFLLWLGREDVSRKQKEKSLKVIRELGDGWGDVNTPHAYFLAAAAIGQFPDYSEAAQIIAMLVQWGYATDGNTSARAALQQSDRSLVLGAVIDLFSRDRQKYQFWSAVAELRSIAGDSWEAQAYLIGQLQTDRADYTDCLVATTLAQIDPGNPDALQSLTELLHRSLDRQTLSLAVSSWKKVGTGNNDAIAALTKLLYWSQDPKLREQVAELLADIDPGNDYAEEVLHHEQVSTEELQEEQPVEEYGHITQEQLIHLALEIQSSSSHF